MSIVLTLLMSMLGVAAGGAESCRRVSTPPSSFGGETLAPGEYRIVFVATKGPRKRKSVEGSLILKPTSTDDASPAIGERVEAFDTSATPLYGWLEANLQGVAAPICFDAPHPEQESTGPISLGVLVHLIDLKDGYQRTHQF